MDVVPVFRCPQWIGRQLLDHLREHLSWLGSLDSVAAPPAIVSHRLLHQPWKLC